MGCELIPTAKEIAIEVAKILAEEKYVNEAPRDLKSKYPLLRVSTKSDTVVLFTTYGVGTVVSSSVLQVGYWYDDWDSRDFTSFNGKITLRNGLLGTQ